MTVITQSIQWEALSQFITERMGLHFPPERLGDLKRGFITASQEFGFDHPETCIEWLLSAVLEKSDIQILARHLTIGETYFFRDKQLLEALVNLILPALIQHQRGLEKRLRFWCAGCCTGEEAYTLAIILHQLLPDLDDWQITINATDINLHFINKATNGIYSEWSFRNAPTWLKNRYFKSVTNGHFMIAPEIKKLVSFSHLNLVEDSYPSLNNNTNAMNLIFCRNVLMYFDPVKAQKVIGNLSNALVDGGWLLVSPSEASSALYPQFTPVNHSGAILLQKHTSSPLINIKPKSVIPMETFSATVTKTHLPLKSPYSISDAIERVPAKAAEESSDQLAFAQSLYSQGRYAEVVDALNAMNNDNAPKHTHHMVISSLLTRSLANLGQLEQALQCCNRWISADKVDATGYYIRALILLESGNIKQACSSIQQAIFLRPNFVLAYFSLGNIAHNSGEMEEACKHYSSVRRMLGAYQPNDVLPESDNLTVAQLTEIINAMPMMETVQ